MMIIMCVCVIVCVCVCVCVCVRACNTASFACIGTCAFGMPKPAPEDMQVGVVWTGNTIISLSLRGELTYLDAGNITTPKMVIRFLCMHVCMFAYIYTCIYVFYSIYIYSAHTNTHAHDELI